MVGFDVFKQPVSIDLCAEAKAENMYKLDSVTPSNSISLTDLSHLHLIISWTTLNDEISVLLFAVLLFQCTYFQTALNQKYLFIWLEYEFKWTTITTSDVAMLVVKWKQRALAG